MRYIVFIFLIVTTLANASATHFGNAADLHLTAQDINISPDQVLVIYKFVNNSSKDITQSFVFPLPDNNAESIKQFKVQVNGNHIPYKTRQRAISTAGIDATETLKNLRLPLNPVAAMHSIDTSQNRKIIADGLKAANLVDQKEETPLWFVQTIYYWEHTFPAHSTTTITQTYKPAITTKSVKISSASGILKTPINFIKRAAKLAVKWTLEDDNAATHLQNQLEKGFPQIMQFCPSRDDYLLLAANQNSNIITMKELFYNSFNPSIVPAIQNYNLNITTTDDLHPLVCWNGSMKKSAHNLHFSAKDYVPLQDLRVLFVGINSKP